MPSPRPTTAVPAAATPGSTTPDPGLRDQPPQVRAGLAAQGIVVPADTVATAAPHDTTTDDLLIDQPAGPLAGPGKLWPGCGPTPNGRPATNRERLAQLPGATADGERRQVHRRAGDWAEPCPEWGLAGNAAFVIGPRSLTRHQDLQGRVFLHSYDPASDGDAAVLTTIPNAPVVVAQWINSQYYFSTVGRRALRFRRQVHPQRGG